MIALSLAAPLVLRIMAPASFDTASLAAVVSIVLLSSIPFAWYASNLRRMLAFRSTRSLVYIAPICALINVLLNLLLVPHLGIEGSAIATVLAFAVLAILVGIIGRQFVTLRSDPHVCMGSDVWSHPGCLRGADSARHCTSQCDPYYVGGTVRTMAYGPC